MNVWELCIRRPIFTLMLVSAPVVLGLAAYPRLGVDLFPDVDLPVVVVTTTLKGASVEEMESSVTKEIEEAVNTISGIDELRSTTKEGYCQVVIQFRLEKDGDAAAQEVRDKISTILSRLPTGTDPPLIDKFDIDATPVATIAVSGRRNLREVTEIARKQIKEELETVTGVGSVVLVGGQRRAIHICWTRTSWRPTSCRPRMCGRPLRGRTWNCPAGASTRGRRSWCCGPWGGWIARRRFSI